MSFFTTPRTDAVAPTEALAVRSPSPSHVPFLLPNDHGQALALAPLAAATAATPVPAMTAATPMTIVPAMTRAPCHCCLSGHGDATAAVAAAASTTNAGV